MHVCPTDFVLFGTIGMALSALGLLAVGIGLVSGQMFGQLPSNATAGEGTSAEFSCSVLSTDPSPIRLDSVWAVLVPGNIELILGISGVEWIALRDISTAFIRPTFNSPLTIANVTRSIEGTRVRCFFFVGVDPTSQPEPYAFLTVLYDPTIPMNSRVVDFTPFSATLQWDPPSDRGGSLLPLTYTVTLNSTSSFLTFSNITHTSLSLTSLKHSTHYSWSVQAMNKYGAGPSLWGTFITNDSVPIIDTVDAAVLSLFELEVKISLLTNGGQSVTQYIVEVRGKNYTFPSSEQMQVSLHLNQLCVNFTQGLKFTLRVFVVNSVGTSDPVSAEAIAPFVPPDIIGDVDTAPVIIGVILAVAIVTFLVILSVLTILVCIKCKCTTWSCTPDSSYGGGKDELKGISSQIEHVELEPNPAYGEVSLATAPADPQPFEECMGGVTSSNAVMEENPAYQSAEPQPYECVGGLTNTDVAMEENPSYQSVDTQTVLHAGEPVYI